MSNTLAKFRPTQEEPPRSGGRLANIRERVHQPFYDTLVRGIGISSVAAMGATLSRQALTTVAIEVEDTVRVEEHLAKQEPLVQVKPLGDGTYVVAVRP